MVKFDSSEAVFRSDARQLLKIMNLDEATPDAWNGQDLAAMLRHQLAAPLAFDLSSVEMEGAEARRRDRTLTGAAKERITNFEDLLFHREPPIELLILSKEFFKRRLQECKKDSPEWNVAYLLYLLSILAARDRASKISSLTWSELREGMKWALQRRWMNEKTRHFVELAAQAGSP
jgi:integrase